MISVLPSIAFTPTGFTFSCTLGQGNPPPQIVEVWNAGGGSLNWTASEEAGWLSLTPTSGSSTGEYDPITLSVDASGLPAGTYTATITLAAAGADNSPQQIPVIFTLVPATITITYNLIAGWNMVTVPVDAGTNPDDVFGGLPTGWLIYAWDAVHGVYKVKADISITWGVGYWLKSPTSVPYAVTGIPNMAPTISLSLASGWNLIGTPYHQPVGWDLIHVRKAAEVKTLGDAMLAGWIKGSFYRWTGSAYELITSGGIFQPTSGYWLKALQEGCALEVTKP